MLRRDSVDSLYYFVTRCVPCLKSRKRRNKVTKNNKEIAMSNKGLKFSEAMAAQRAMCSKVDGVSRQKYSNQLKSLVAKAAKEVQRHRVQGTPLVRKAK